GNMGWGLVCNDRASSVIFSACSADSIKVEPVMAEYVGACNLLWSTI
ncbi:hypothetical protein A2U01_0100464, partial [Trifolium medium]|nr:hypothetical protein [Trifolium medium]